MIHALLFTLCIFILLLVTLSGQGHTRLKGIVIPERENVNEKLALMFIEC